MTKREQDGFDMTWYVGNVNWLADDYLVQPPSATKRCRVCGDRKYSVEFRDCPEYIDNKLPACDYCMKNRRRQSWQYLDSTEVKRTCYRCQEVKPIKAFGVDTNYHSVNWRCYECL